MISLFGIKGMGAVTFLGFGLFVVGMIVGYFIQEKRRTLQVLKNAFPGSVLCKDAGR
jgi:glucose uptake protein GlcU